MNQKTQYAVLLLALSIVFVGLPAHNRPSLAAQDNHEISSPAQSPEQGPIEGCQKHSLHEACAIMFTNGNATASGRLVVVTPVPNSHVIFTCSTFPPTVSQGSDPPVESGRFIDAFSCPPAGHPEATTLYFYCSPDDINPTKVCDVEILSR